MVKIIGSGVRPSGFNPSADTDTLVDCLQSSRTFLSLSFLACNVGTTSETLSRDSWAGGMRSRAPSSANRVQQSARASGK